MSKHTRNEWRRCPLGDELVKASSDIVFVNFVPFDILQYVPLPNWVKVKNTLETGGKDVKTHSKRVGKM
jgi:hypothetical protein